MRSDERRRTYRKLFDLVAPDYDRPGVEFFQTVGRRLVSLAGVADGDRVLDIGCGRGAVLFPASDAVGPRGFVVGVDLSTTMVEATRRDCAERGYDQVSVLVMDGQAPSLPDGSFDVVLGSMSLHMLSSPRGAYAEFRRLLKEPGRLGGSVLKTIASPEPVVFGLRSIGEMLARYPRVEAPAEMESFDDVRRLQSDLRDNGFGDLHIHDEDVLLRAVSPEQLVAWTWTHGMRLLWHRIPRSEHDRWSTRIASEAASHRDHEGGIAIPVVVRYFVAHRTAQAAAP